MSIISECNSSGENIIPKVISASGLTEYSYIAQNDTYIIVSGWFTQNNIIKIEKKLTTEIKLNNIELIFSKGVGIGDSLTQGDQGDGKGVTSFNYPFYFNKMSGITFDNDGVSGFTATDSWLYKVKDKNYSSYDFVVLFLGQNQGLTDTVESDTSGSDFNNFANTYTGNYCKIICKIKQDNPKCKIFACTIPNNGSTSQFKIDTNNVIKKIATKYNLKVIDLYNNEKLNYFGRSIRANDNIHYKEKIGYSILAESIKEEINNIVKNDISYFV